MRKKETTYRRLPWPLDYNGNKPLNERTRTDNNAVPARAGAGHLRQRDRKARIKAKLHTFEAGTCAGGATAIQLELFK